REVQYAGERGQRQFAVLVHEEPQDAERSADGLGSGGWLCSGLVQLASVVVELSVKARLTRAAAVPPPRTRIGRGNTGRTGRRRPLPVRTSASPLDARAGGARARAGPAGAARGHGRAGAVVSRGRFPPDPESDTLR